MNKKKCAFTLSGATHVTMFPITVKYAFTLSEVLITLGIIGVVAAITVPVLAAKIQDKVNIARWKKTYAVLANAFYAVKGDGIGLCATNNRYNPNVCSNGNPNRELDIGYWNPEFMQAFLSKLKVSKTCGGGVYKFTDYTCENGVDGYVWYFNWVGSYASLGGKYEMKTVSFAGRHPIITFRGASGSSTLGHYVMDEQAVLLLNGTVLYFGGWPSGPWIIADVDGWRSGPNMVGKDVFGVQLFEDKILPSGAPGSTGYNDPSAGASGCSKDVGLATTIDFHKIKGAGCSYKYLMK